MTPNELADEYKEWKGDFLSLLEWGADAEKMLRHLQAENEALKKQLEACALLNYNKGHEDGRKLVITPQTKLLQFPTMLRRMWSGSEVQAWLNEQARCVK